MRCRELLLILPLAVLIPSTWSTCAAQQPAPDNESKLSPADDAAWQEAQRLLAERDDPGYQALRRPSGLGDNYVLRVWGSFLECSPMLAEIEVKQGVGRAEFFTFDGFKAGALSIEESERIVRVYCYLRDARRVQEKFVGRLSSSHEASYSVVIQNLDQADGPPLIKTDHRQACFGAGESPGGVDGAHSWLVEELFGPVNVRLPMVERRQDLVDRFLSEIASQSAAPQILDRQVHKLETVRFILAVRQLVNWRVREAIPVLEKLELGDELYWLKLFVDCPTEPFLVDGIEQFGSLMLDYMRDNLAEPLRRAVLLTALERVAQAPDLSCYWVSDAANDICELGISPADVERLRAVFLRAHKSVQVELLAIFLSAAPSDTDYERLRAIVHRAERERFQIDIASRAADLLADYSQRTGKHVDATAVAIRELIETRLEESQDSLIGLTHKLGQLGRAQDAGFLKGIVSAAETGSIEAMEALCAIEPEAAGALARAGLATSLTTKTNTPWSDFNYIGVLIAVGARDAGPAIESACERILDGRLNSYNTDYCRLALEVLAARDVSAECEAAARYCLLTHPPRVLRDALAKRLRSAGASDRQVAPLHTPPRTDRVWLDCKRWTWQKKN